MSLLNIPSDGTPNEMLALYRLVNASRRLKKEKLLAVCSPVSACPESESDSRPRKTLTNWTKLGLFDDDGTEVSLTPDAPKDERRLPSFLRSLVFHPDNNVVFWGEEDLKSADFSRGLSWCLAWEPMHFAGQGWEFADGLQEATLPADRRLFKNDVRWNGLKSWAVFLGFAWVARYPKSASLVVDPTPAIRETLAAVFGASAELSDKEFLARLRERLPVLDGGGYRVRVEGEMLRERWNAVADGRLSASLSLALLRLEAEGTLGLLDPHDATAGKTMLWSDTRSNPRTFSAVTHTARSA